MEGEQPENGRRWIHTSGDHPKVISRKTLFDLSILLKGPPATLQCPPPEHDGAVAFRVPDMAELREVGGIARVECGTQPPLAIARIGRTSFAAYRPAANAPGGLEELMVEYVEETGVLRVRW